MEVSIERPVGKDGETDRTMVPTAEVGVTVVMAVPLVSVNEFGLRIEVGAISLTTMVWASAVVLPPVLLAVMV